MKDIEPDLQAHANGTAKVLLLSLPTLSYVTNFIAVGRTATHIIPHMKSTDQSAEGLQSVPGTGTDSASQNVRLRLLTRPQTEITKQGYLFKKSRNVWDLKWTVVSEGTSPPLVLISCSIS